MGSQVLCYVDSFFWVFRWVAVLAWGCGLYVGGWGHGLVAPVSDEDLHDASLMALGVEQLRRLSVGQTPLGAKLWL